MAFLPLKTEDQINLTYNPLRFLTLDDIEGIIDQSRNGNISRLQVLYELVEQSSLTLGMCISRRKAALPDWTIRRKDLKRFKDFDENLAQEQEALLNYQFSEAEDSGTFLDALHTLQMAIFRGIGVIQPIYDTQGNLKRFVSFDSWNFCLDPQKDEYGRHALYWNPSGLNPLNFKETLDEIPFNQVICNLNSNPIDSHGLRIYLAETLGLECYAQLVARKGLPATYITAPENLDDDNLKTWAKKAVEVTKGGSGAFPFGTVITSEKIDPNNGASIERFLDYNQKQIVLASTGGILTSLTAPTGLGSGVADAQADVFRSIVKGDAKKIGDLLNRSVANALLDIFFPGKPHLVYFDLLEEEKADPSKYLQDASLAKAAGFDIDETQLAELTGYKLTKAPEEPAPMTFSEEPEKPENPGSSDEYIVPRKTEKVENLDEAEEEPEEESSEEPDLPKADVSNSMKLLKAFDIFLAPIKKLAYKLAHAKTDDDAKEAKDQIEDEIERLTNADDSEYSRAVLELMTDQIEKENDEQEQSK